MRKVKIVSHGSYIPKKVVQAKDLDEKMGLNPGTVSKKSQIETRYHVTSETASKMGSYAVMEALENKGLNLNDIDALICTSGTGEQEIPSNASLILSQLGKNTSHITAFDINSTCLGFVTGLDTISYLVDAGRFKRVAIVSSEIASIGINYDHLESACLFGDGAACVILEKTPENESSKIFFSGMEIHSEGVDHCRLVGGGTKIHPREYGPSTSHLFHFEMNGKAVFKLALQVAPNFVKKLFKDNGMSLQDMDLVIPHQASANGLNIVQKKLEIPNEKWVNIISDYGNMISASIPFALKKMVDDERLKRGDKVFLFGTSAGFGVGGLVFEY